MIDNSSFEEYFHDDWARSIAIDDVMVDEFFEACTAPENRYIMKKIGNVKGQKILDLGCGAGEASVYFSKNGAIVTGIDNSAEMLNVLRSVGKKYNVTVQTKKCNSDNIDSDDEVFDIVYAANLLHHVNIESTLREVHRVLKKGGIFTCWDPLLYNPVIKIYRKLAKDVRTEEEHPITKNDIKLFNKYFQKVEIHMTWLFTLFIFIKFFLIERVSPNKERYWKKILIEHKRLEKTYTNLEKVDMFVLKHFPFMRKYCWNITVIAEK